MKYSFICPLGGCKETMTVEAKNDDDAVDKLTEKAKEHLALSHPDIEKTDEEIRNDIKSQMTSEDIDETIKTVM